MDRTRWTMLLVTLVPLVLFASPAAGRADVNVPDVVVAPPAARVRPVPGSAARWVLESRSRPVLRRRAAAAAAAPRRSSLLAVALSAIVPGAGELYLGLEKRGVALMAVEAAAWTGYFVKRSDGLDKRAAYETFADRHWSLSKLLADHPLFPGTGSIEELDQLGAQSAGSGVWPGYIPWTAKAEDKQHYYENIGKYDWYIAGWEDWDATAQPPPRDTALRDEYRRMRIASNDALDASNRFIWLSVAARVFSLAETLYIVHTRGAEVRSERVESTGWRVRAAVRPAGTSSLALEYRFR